MIQRIQSVWLLLSAVLTALAIFFPLVSISGVSAGCNGTAGIDIYSYVIQYSESCGGVAVNAFTMSIFMAITAVLNIVVIFLFNKRKLQIKLTHYSFLLKVALVAVIVFYTFTLKGSFEDEHIIPQIGSLFLIIAMILDWLAVKGIRKDEALVRSVDRIR